MANSAVLEKELTSIEEWSRSIEAADREHNSHVAENYQNLMHGNFENKVSASVAVAEKAPEAPAYPSAAQRLADYVPVAFGMKKRQRIGDTPTYSATNVIDYAPVQTSETEKRPLFEGLVYRDGELIDLNAPQAPVYEEIPVEAAIEAPVMDTVAEVVEAPVYEPSFAPTIAPVYEPTVGPAFEEHAEEDALPTKKTMETIRQESETSAGFFAALSTKTKVVLAAVAATIILMIAIVCINTAVINRINVNIKARRLEIEDLQQTSEEIQSQISEITDSEAIAEWAAQHGMEMFLG